MSLLVEHAKMFAIGAHLSTGIIRNWSDYPYHVHVCEVAEILEDAGENDYVIAAGYLHDTVEDTKVQQKDILEHFGATVDYLVDGCTDKWTDHSLGNRAYRKKKEAERIWTYDHNVHNIKLADFISNFPTILENDKGFAKLYLKEKEFLLSGFDHNRLNPVLHVEVLDWIEESKKVLEI